MGNFTINEELYNANKFCPNPFIPAESPVLSICICSLHPRIEMLTKLLLHLGRQKTDEVEILVEVDNGEMTTGAKRNKLYNQAKGKYVVSVDDDDWVPDYYVSEILKAVESDPDAVATNGTMTTDGGPAHTWDISIRNPYITTGKRDMIHYLRFPNHISPIRRSIAIKYPFPDKSFGEDYAFALAMHVNRAIKTEVKISKPMYEYRYVSKKVLV